jgi:hypothetical protein
MLVALLVTWLLAVRSEPSDLLSGTFKFADIDTYYQMYDVLPETKGARVEPMHELVDQSPISPMQQPYSRGATRAVSSWCQVQLRQLGITWNS